MLEHLDRNDAVVVLDDIQGALVVADVARDDVDVADVVSALLGSSKYVLSLRMAVGDARDLAVGVLLRKMERHGSPTAAEINDLHTILNLGPLTIQIEHCNLRLFEGCGFGRPKTTGVLLTRAEAHIIKGGWDLVVLLIGLVGGNGDGGIGFQLIDDGHLALHVGLGSLRSEDGDVVRQAQADAKTDE